MNERSKTIRIILHDGQLAGSENVFAPRTRVRVAAAAPTSMAPDNSVLQETPETTTMPTTPPGPKRYLCPHCGTMLETDEPIEGLQVPCPECGATFIAKALQKPKLRAVRTSASSPSPSRTSANKISGGKCKIVLRILLTILLLVGGFAGLWCAGVIQHIQSPEQNGTEFWTARANGVEWKFTVDGNTVEIRGATVKQPNSNVTIPTFFGWRKTTSIGDRSFLECNTIKSVCIPNSVTNIGLGAFTKCENLSSVKISSGLKEIGYCAFGECKKLTSIRIPASVTTIGEFAFLSCENLKILSLPDSLEHIGQGAFEKCHALTEIHIPDRVREISTKTFQKCDNLRTVHIGNGVTNIGNRAFVLCNELARVEMGPNVKRIGEYAFGGCNSLKTLVLPNNVTHIDFGAFAECTALESINLPEELESLGYRLGESGVFDGCIALTNMTIPPKVNVLSTRLFAGCKNLKTVELPDGLKTIGAFTFLGCENLSDIKIPESVRFIFVGAFEKCKSLKTINLPSGIDTIWSGTFDGCTSLREMAIPEGVTDILSEAFQECRSLVSVDIPNSVTNICESAFAGCVSLTNVAIPPRVTAIEAMTFQACTNLPGIVIPNGVTNIGERAFAGCRSLTNLHIPDSVESMADDVFLFCEGLQRLRVPASWQKRKGLFGNEKWLQPGCKIIYGDGMESSPSRSAPAATPPRKNPLSGPVLPEFATLAKALETAKRSPTGANYKALMTAWEELPKKQKDAASKPVLWAFCAMLMSHGHAEAASKRQHLINYKAFLDAVSDPCHDCEGRGSSQNTCKVCAGSGIKHVRCSTCNGLGNCLFCQGRGQTGGVLSAPTRCLRCAGTGRCPTCLGRTIEIACPNCRNGMVTSVCHTYNGTGRIVSASKCDRVIKSNIDEALRICHGENPASAGDNTSYDSDDWGFGDGWN